jgi:hypothetical protein
LAKLQTTTSIPEEVFAALEYVSEIPTVGQSFLRSLGTPKPKASFEQFRAFIRQGKTFFQAAQALHFRAGALMYYYAFLNLAKAFILITDPKSVSGRIQHGLSLGPVSRRPLSSQAVPVASAPGVFHRFYQIQMGVPLPPALRLNMGTLLGYASDVKYEYEHAGYGSHRVLPVKCRFLSHQASRITWPVLAVSDFSNLSLYKKSLKSFMAYFEPISPPRNLIRSTFDIYAEDYPHYMFFQSIKAYQWTLDDSIDLRQIRHDILAACGPMFQAPIYDDGHDFCLALPLRKTRQLPMNESLAIYSAMFFLGSLVRYRPAYLEGLLDSTDAWIIERFVKASPLTFIRYVTNLILGTDYIFTMR